jgi:hypothetical protein
MFIEGKGGEFIIKNKVVSNFFQVKLSKVVVVVVVVRGRGYTIKKEEIYTCMFKRICIYICNNDNNNKGYDISIIKRG